MTAVFDDTDLLEPAFAVENIDDEFDLDIPPTSGMEYLRRVQMEAKQCPHVVVADIDTTPYSSKQTVKVSLTSGLHPAPRGFAPSNTWQKTQIANFSNLRQKMARHKAKTKKQNLKTAAKLPKKENIEGWCQLCFGRIQPLKSGTSVKEVDMDATEDTTSSSTASDTETYTAKPPLVSIVAAMDQATIVQVLEYHINWFEATGFSAEQGRWFYSLLTVLEKPLSPEACSLLRSLARNCANLRATLENRNDELLTPLNLFITLVSSYFDQTDMADSR